MDTQIEIKCLCCGRPRVVEPKTIYAYICSDCTKKLKQEFEEKNKLAPYGPLSDA